MISGVEVLEDAAVLHSPCRLGRGSRVAEAGRRHWSPPWRCGRGELSVDLARSAERIGSQHGGSVEVQIGSPPTQPLSMKGRC